jgi:hypothetical protein
MDSRLTRFVKPSSAPCNAVVLRRWQYDGPVRNAWRIAWSTAAGVGLALIAWRSRRRTPPEIALDCASDASMSVKSR